MNLFWRFFVAVLIDIIDFFIGRVPGFGTVADIINTTISVALWGPYGFVAGLEVFDVTDQIDAFVPTVTISGLIAVYGGGVS